MPSFHRSLGVIGAGLAAGAIAVPTVLAHGGPHGSRGGGDPTISPGQLCEQAGLGAVGDPSNGGRWHNDPVIVIICPGGGSDRANRRKGCNRRDRASRNDRCKRSNRRDRASRNDRRKRSNRRDRASRNDGRKRSDRSHRASWASRPDRREGSDRAVPTGPSGGPPGPTGPTGPTGAKGPTGGDRASRSDRRERSNRADWRKRTNRPQRAPGRDHHPPPPQEAKQAVSKRNSAAIAVRVAFAEGRSKDQLTAATQSSVRPQSAGARLAGSQGPRATPIGALSPAAVVAPAAMKCWSTCAPPRLARPIVPAAVVGPVELLSVGSDAEGLAHAGDEAPCTCEPFRPRGRCWRGRHRRWGRWPSRGGPARPPGRSDPWRL